MIHWDIVTIVVIVLVGVFIFSKRIERKLKRKGKKKPPDDMYPMW